MALNASLLYWQKYFFLISLSSSLYFIHRSCITHGNIVLKGVNRCLEKVKTSEQPRWLCCPCKQCSLFIDLKRKIIEDTLEDKRLSSPQFQAWPKDRWVNDHGPVSWPKICWARWRASRGPRKVHGPARRRWPGCTTAREEMLTSTNLSRVFAYPSVSQVLQAQLVSKLWGRHCIGQVLLVRKY